MSTANATEADHINEDASDVISRRIWFEPTNLGGASNELPPNFTIAEELRKQLVIPLSDGELLVIDPFATLTQLSDPQRHDLIDSYWEKNNHVGVTETVLNLLLVTMITWTVAFIFALGLRVLMS